jgi:tetratricopeptide (TPR) repeat protein
VVLATSVAAWFGVLTHERNEDFSSEERIWMDTVAKRPDNPRARVNYGVILASEQRVPEAEHQLREGVRLKESSAPAHSSLGTILCATGRIEECVTHLERAVALDPKYKDAYASLGEAYGSQGRRRLAAKYFALAADAAPDNAFLLNRLAWLLATALENDVRDSGRAVRLAERSVQLTSRRDVMSLDTLAAAYAEADRFDDAVTTAREALALAQQRGDTVAMQDLSRKADMYAAHQKYRE